MWKSMATRSRVLRLQGSGERSFRTLLRLMVKFPWEFLFLLLGEKEKAKEVTSPPPRTPLRLHFLLPRVGRGRPRGGASVALCVGL